MALPLLGRRNRELEDGLLVGQLLVDGGERVQLVLELGRGVRVEQHLEHLCAVGLHAQPLADDLSRVDHVL